MISSSYQHIQCRLDSKEYFLIHNGQQKGCRSRYTKDQLNTVKYKQFTSIKRHENSNKTLCQKQYMQIFLCFDYQKVRAIHWLSLFRWSICLIFLFLLLVQESRKGEIPKRKGEYLTRDVTGCVANFSTPCTLKMSQKYNLSHKCLAESIHYPWFQENSENVLPHDTLSNNFYQKPTPCQKGFTVKGHAVEQHIPSSQT